MGDLILRGELSVSDNTSIEVKVADGGVVVGEGGGSNGPSMVWTMRGYSNSGLSNFDWAQAVVQNKPLSEPRESSESKSEDTIVIVDSDDEKEEGELEEGEIGLDFASHETESVVLESDNRVEDDRIHKESDLEKKVKLIRGVLESTSLIEAHTGFEGVCSRLLGALESLRELVSENDDFTKRDTLMQLSFASLQTINSVFSSMSYMSKELNKETMSRLLSLVNDHFSRFLSSNQMKEIEAMISAIAPCAGTSSEENVNLMTRASNVDSFLAKNMASEGTHRGSFYVRNRLPLLDLHKDHDADSLPSPTRETTPSLPVNGRHAMVKPSFLVGGQMTEGAKVYPYESEAFKAVSTYQKRYGNNSVFKTDDLPSPTPSGEAHDGNGDIGGEVFTKPGTLMAHGQDVPLPSTFNSRSMPVPNAVSRTGATQTNLTSDQTVKPSAKSRDPRLRLAKPDGANVTTSSYSSADLVNSRKQKATDELFVHGHACKRKKSDKDAPKLDGTGGWLEETESLEILKLESKPRLTQKLTDPRRAAQLPGSSVPPGSAPPLTPSVESGTIRMKPRDPRRILHGATLKKTDKDVKHNPSNRNDQEEGVSVSAASVTAATIPTRSMDSWGEVEHLFGGYDDTQRVAIQKERTRRLEEQKKMFASRKLSLVLDLDHTLLNSAKFHEVETTHETFLRKKEEQDRDKLHRHLFRFPHMGLWTKLRPGVWNFLEKASKLYELHVYTMGNKLYATEMAKLLDPKGVLFNGRVIAKGDDGDSLDGDERVPKTKDLEGVMGMESSVVIVDDSVRVWPHNKMNLIVVERYTYFPCSRRQFGLLGPSLLEVDLDERPEEGTLASTLAVIEEIHRNFFSHTSLDQADVRNILASEQQKILAGCRIVFSRIIRVGETKPHLHPLWQTAERFGAVCTTKVDEHVTHVVTNSLGTDKVNWALTRGKFVVHPGWVEASAFLYQRANESNFAIKP